MQSLFGPKPAPPGIAFGPGFGDYQQSLTGAFPTPSATPVAQPWTQPAWLPPGSAMTPWKTGFDPRYGWPGGQWAAPDPFTPTQPFHNGWAGPFRGPYR